MCGKSSSSSGFTQDGWDLTPEPQEQHRLSPPWAQDQVITNCSHIGSDTGTFST